MSEVRILVPAGALATSIAEVHAETTLHYVLQMGYQCLLR